jgi:glycerophosphoryl diester phosphodiesterase
VNEAANEAANEPGIVLPRVVAHRGASHEAPENTLAAFRRAWDLGVECVELDLHLTRDGHVVVIHDASARRTTGLDREIRDLTLAELEALDAGRWMSPRFSGERIPTIGQALATIPVGRTMFLEIKSGPETAPALAHAILAADPRPRGARIALQGFDPDALAAFASALPGAPAYWTVMPPLDEQDEPLPYPREVIDEAVRRGFPGLALLHVSVDDPLVEAARQAGLEVDLWTLNEPADLARWYPRAGIRWIETDRPDLVAATK